MTRPRRGGLGFGGAAGLGVAGALLITVIATGRALAAQLEGAARTVIVFAEIAVCVILGAATLAALGLLVYGGLLGRIKIAERQLNLEQLARQASAGQAEPGASWAVRGEVPGGGAGALSPGGARPAIPANVTSDQPAAIMRHYTEEDRHL